MSGLPYASAVVEVDAAARRVVVTLPVPRAASGEVGWQLFDPATDCFLREGDWLPLGEADPLRCEIQLPGETGPYHVYLSQRQDGQWLYATGAPFLLLTVTVQHGRLALDKSEITSLPALRRQRTRAAAGRFFTLPLTSIWRNRQLVRTMARRDLLARYRGSFGDFFWTLLNPLLLMSTYYFVFGVVLRTRFAGDSSKSGYVLYFLAGMLPWLAFSEAVGRAPSVIPEHRNIVKKLVFPLETLPMNPVLAALGTTSFAFLLFLAGLLLARGAVPSSVLALPIVLVPQLLLTLGLSWLLSALGAYVRDLGQVIGFLLTLWFFLTPICYPEAQLPPGALVVLTQNPVYWLVRSYRAILLEGHVPATILLVKLWTVASITFFCGHAVFHRLKRSFADIL